MVACFQHLDKTLFLCIYIRELAGAPELVFINTTVSQISLEGCFGGNQVVELRILSRENVTWLEAKYGCEHLGYASIHSSASDYIRWFLIRDVLAKNGYHDNVTFWEGRFRPYSHSEVWFNNWCTVVEDDLSVQDPFDQCAVVHWNSTEGKHVIIPRSCDLTYPYICQKRVARKQFDVYEGYSIIDLPSDVEQKNAIYSANISECASACMKTKQCTSFLYDIDMTTCRFFIYKPNVGSAMFTITFVGCSALLGFKKGCNTTLTGVPADVPYNEASVELPTCEKSPIPDNYCPVDESYKSDSELEIIVQQLIQNLTVAVKTTSKYKRRLISATDTRTSSISLGAVGIIVLVSVLSLMLCMDLFGVCKKRQIPGTKS